MKNRVLTMLAAAALCLAVIAGCIPATLAFSDVPGSDMSLAAETLAGLGIVSGDGSGSFYPDQGLTRAQFCKIAVLTEGHGSLVSSTAYKTLFSDVPGSSWAAPYVNLAYSEKLVSGYGNGYFGPDDAVTASQAVTIALHLLGYENTDIGPFWPEDYMSKAADLGLLDGVSKAADAYLTRGEAALIIYNLLSMNTAQGKPFYQGLASTTVTSAILMDNDATADDGTAHTAMVYASGAITYYNQSAALPEALVGERGVLLLDSSGKVMGFLPGDTVEKTVIVSETDGSELNGIPIGNSITVLLEDEKTTYQESWYDLRDGDQVVIYYNAAGSIDLLWVKSRAAGTETTLVGYYEDASPNTTAPSTITVLGASLSVTDEGRAALKGFAIGDKLTVTLNADGKVIDAARTTSTIQMVGILKSAGTSKVEVALLSGLTISGEPYSTVASTLVGMLVRVNAAASGELSVSALNYSSTTKALGQMDLASNVRLYEQVNGSVPAEIDLDDILTDSVPAASILHAGTNAAGEVDLLVLNDVTGAAYAYGILNAEVKQTGSGTQSVTNNTVSVENGDGTGTAYITGSSVKDGVVGGVAGNSSGKAAAIVTLTAVKGLIRSDFDGSDSVAGMPIADEVQVYNAVTAKWTTLSGAKAFTNSFTAYYDAHGVVRVIFAE
ncbi:conserved exported hypothetical protein [uncultured Eubacteriales bacterium]|uniref:SLH domain-containing protein n=1 Tax=uncultured Eubacteriales bacterium TaxID=172733 RepID=A0A212J808_9FIRM|nr:conserved exported hypothetical protein [uncultured Eubacteriales bacterium]